MEIFGSAKLFWFALGLAFLIAEVLTPGIVCLFFGFGAWVVLSLLALFAIPAGVQWGVFIVVSVLALMTLRKQLTRLFRLGRVGGRADSLKEPMVAGSYIGREIEVVEEIRPGRPGQAALNGTIWRASSSSPIPKGAMVRVKEVRDLTLEVEPAGSPD